LRTDGSARRLAWGGAWPLAPVALAAVLGAYRLGQKSLWLDEAFSVGVARLDWPATWWLVRTTEPNMALYYALLHGWVRLGAGEAAVRALSVAAAVAVIPVFYVLGVRLVGRRAALLASFLLGANAFFVRYAQEARSYALLLLLTTASWALLLRALERPSTTRWVAYVGGTALAAYTHLFGVWVIAAQLVTAVLVRRWRGAWREFAAALVAIALLLAPLAAWAAASPVTLGWVPRPTMRTLADFAEEITGYGGGWLAALYAALATAFVVGAPRAGRRRATSARAPRDPAASAGDEAVDAGALDARWSAAALVTWLSVPIIGALAVSYLVTPVFYPRFLIISLPPLVLLAAAGAGAIRPRWAAALAMLALFVGEGMGLERWYARMRKEDWRGATAYVLARSAPGDGVVFHAPYVRRAFEYYVLQSGEGASTAPEPLFPSGAWGALDPRNPEITGDFASWWAAHPPRRTRLWVVEQVRRREAARGAPAWLPPDFLPIYCPADSASFIRIRVLLYTSCGRT
jgi:4-amino-4-deoxy-L-arabinose transferase-like glycosyltransferase